MRKTDTARGLLAAAIAALIAATGASGARAAVTEAQARQMIERAYGVKVLKLVKRDFRGRPAYLLTVMSPGGNTDGAFQVNVLALDPETGRLISGFHHLPSGAEAAGGAPLRETDRQPAEALRQGWNWR